MYLSGLFIGGFQPLGSDSIILFLKNFKQFQHKKSGRHKDDDHSVVVLLLS